MFFNVVIFRVFPYRDIFRFPHVVNFRVSPINYSKSSRFSIYLVFHFVITQDKKSAVVVVKPVLKNLNSRTNPVPDPGPDLVPNPMPYPGIQGLISHLFVVAYFCQIVRHSNFFGEKNEVHTTGTKQCFFENFHWRVAHFFSVPFVCTQKKHF